LEVSESAAKQLNRMRERVVGGASLREGDVLLDVGCGDGLIGFGAFEILGPAGSVIFSDISSDLLDRCRDTAVAVGVLPRCRFVLAGATDLHPVATSSVDAVTTRSVLIYVADKPAAFDEFHRVLRPGGRLSIFEPINRFIQSQEPPNEYAGYDLTPVADLWEKVKRIYDRAESPKIGPMLDFDERDLFVMAQRAGFKDLRLDFEAHATGTPPEAWPNFYRSSGNPLAPTLEEAAVEALEPMERDRFIGHLQPLVENGRGTLRRAGAYLTAVKALV
jgi:ubiquinone/menaquinone biosynthesis C-methylase UbiE